MRKKFMAQKFEKWMIPAARKWIQDGWSLNSFSGKHNVSSRTWTVLLQTAPELRVIKEEYEAIRFLRANRKFYEGEMQ